MHKCLNCGKEFDGAFCPNCGMKYQEEKICPQCGSSVNIFARFCTNCGHSFTGAQAADIGALITEQNKPVNDTQAKPENKKKEEKKPAANVEGGEGGKQKTPVGVWIKKHLFIVIPVAVTLVIAIVLLSLIPVFKGSGGSIEGKYYYVDLYGESNEDMYYELKGGKYTYSYTLYGTTVTDTGKYKKDGSTIKFYSDLLDNKVESGNAEIENGVMTLGTGGKFVSDKHKHSYKDDTCACGKTKEEDKMPEEKPDDGGDGTHKPSQHEFTLKKTDAKYLKSEATCESRAVYYYSCSCGAKGSETFESGSLAAHTYKKSNNYCDVCGRRNPAVTSTGLTFELSSDKSYYILTGAGTSTDTEIVIPSTYSSKPVKEISASAFVGNTKIENVVIPDSVTKIGASAFNNCSKLKEVTLGSGITQIGGNAFTNCTKLSKVYITSLAKYFAIDFTGKNSNPVFNAGNLYVNEILASEITVPSGVTSIKDYALYNCTCLEKIYIGKGVTSIGTYALANCSALTEINYAGTKTQWGNITKGSSWDSGATKYKLNYSVEADKGNEGGTAQPVPGDTEIEGPDTPVQVVEELSYALSSDGKSYIVYGIGTCRGTNIVIPSTYENKSVTAIADYALRDCSKLTSITIPTSVKEIGEGAFSGCGKLESITLPFIGARAGVKSTDTYQYPLGYIFGTSSYTGGASTSQRYHGTSTSGWNITTYYIPTSLKSVTLTGGNLLYGAFYNCDKLENVTLPGSLTNIENAAFYGCTSFTKINFNGTKAKWNGVTKASGWDQSTGDYTVYCTDGNITKGSGNSSVDQPVNQPNEKPAEVASTGLSYSLVSGNQSYYVSGIGTCNDKNIVIPSTYNSKPVTEIGAEAFEYCNAIKSVEIPSSVTKIGTSAFYWCTALESITFKGTKAQWNAVTKVYGWDASTGNYTVYCTDGNITKGNAEAVTPPSEEVKPTPEEVKPSEGLAYGQHYGEEKYYVSGMGTCTDKKVVIPSTYEGLPVTSIGGLAFSFGTITSITIPKSIDTIESGAFYGCSQLTSITFLGTKAEWAAVNKISGWNTSTGSYTVHCTDGDVAK